MPLALIKSLANLQMGTGYTAIFIIQIDDTYVQTLTQAANGILILFIHHTKCQKCIYNTLYWI